MYEMVERSYVLLYDLEELGFADLGAIVVELVGKGQEVLLAHAGVAYFVSEFF